MAQLGITMIEMYVKQVKDDFAPVLAELEAYESRIKEETIDEVRREMGIADLILKKAELEATLSEITAKIDRVEWKYGGDASPVGKEVTARLTKRLNGTSKEIRAAIDNVIRKVKLAGVSQEMANVFQSIPNIVASMAEKVKSLPPPEIAMLPRKRIKH